MHNYFSAFLLLCALYAHAQIKQVGPVITEFGEVWEVDKTDFTTDTAKEFRVVFDIMDSPESHGDLNKSIETAARFLNMHAQSGVAPENMKIALVVHNAATKDILTDEGYRKRYGVPNPNSQLVQDLLGTGADVILCGQSSMSRKIPIEESIKGVQLALSAMTALVQLQGEDYQLIKF
jgi:intracellular sulfur oxidation DsrE/DsrF family protein